MSSSVLRLGKLFGIPIEIDYSWFLIFALITWTLASGYYPNEFKNWPTAQYWIVGAVTAGLFFISVLLHELGHSLVARGFHLPVNRITLFIFGGISEINEEPKGALSEFWITIAGPLVSFGLAAAFWLLTFVFAGFQEFLALFKYLALINLILAIFNLIPGFPLDGGGVLMAVIWGISHNRRRAVLIAGSVGSFFAYLFIVVGVYQAFSGNLLNGIWTAFIGWFLLNASGSRVRQERIKDALGGHTVSEAMSHGYTRLEAGTTLQCLLDDHILNPGSEGRRIYIIEEDDQVAGLVTQHMLRNVPRQEWAHTTLAQVMLPIDQWKKVAPDTELWQAIEKMDQNGVNQLPVVVDGHIQGMLTREDVIGFIRRLQSPQVGSLGS